VADQGLPDLLRLRGVLPDAADRDRVIVRLGVPGVVRAVVVDTAFFTGNYPQACSADACWVSGYPSAGESASAAGQEGSISFPTGAWPRLRLYGSLTDDGLAGVRQRWDETGLSADEKSGGVI
jgi:allantoicase